MGEPFNGRKLKREMLDAIESYNRASSVHRKSATHRYCSSDRYDGVEYKFYGAYIPIVPIIDTVREVPNARIEHMAHVTDGYEPYLVVFVAEIPSYLGKKAFV